MDWLTGTWALGPAIAVFVAGAVALGVLGPRLARLVDRLADRTGLGEAIAGAVLLGAATSLAGLVVSVTAAAQGNASLALSNSVGGIAAQTSFLVVADLAYRRANLEHAAASLTNVFSSLLMVLLLALVAAAAVAPEVALFGVHPLTPLLFGLYLAGVHLARRVGADAMWLPRDTPRTDPDEPEAQAQRASLSRMLVSFVVLGATVAVLGYLIALSGLSLIERTGLSATFVGAFFTSVATSLPELVTSVAAVRAGAPTLAIGGIVGGNTFDVLFVGAGDIAYRSGSLYHQASPQDLFVVAWTITLVAVAAMGLVVRQERGIGFEGIGIALLYVAGLAVVVGMS